MSENTLQMEIEEVHRKLIGLRQEYWRHYDLFSPQWWLLLVILIVPWIVWWRLVDKSRLPAIVLFGVAISYLIFFLDHVGYEGNLWLYPHKLIQIIPEASPVDLGILPVAHLLVFQYFKRWPSFLIANAIMAAFFAFVAEPLSVWIDFYKLLHWKYVYSFPLYILKAALVKGAVDLVFNRSRRAALN